MAVPSSGALSLYGLAKEKELNNYDNTIPISTYKSYYATPISLGNLATGTGGFDATNDGAIPRPNPYAPHVMSEWYGYDHDYIWVPNYAANPINKPASYLFWPYGYGNLQNDPWRQASQYIRRIGYTSWVVDQNNVYRNGYYTNAQRVSETLDFLDWTRPGDDSVNSDPFFAANAENRVNHSSYLFDTGSTFEIYLEATSAWRFYDIIVTAKRATINPVSVTNSNSYIYISWSNTSNSATCDVTIDFKFYPNPLV